MILISKCRNLFAHQISMRYLNLLLSYYYFRFPKISHFSATVKTRVVEMGETSVSCETNMTSHRCTLAVIIQVQTEWDLYCVVSLPWLIWACVYVTVCSASDAKTSKVGGVTASRQTTSHGGRLPDIVDGAPDSHPAAPALPQRGAPSWHEIVLRWVVSRSLSDSLRSARIMPSALPPRTRPSTSHHAAC